MKNNEAGDAPVMHIVHCIDTEGPLTEDINETFKRLKVIFQIDIEPSKDNLIKLQNKRINLSGLEDEVATVISPTLLNYNESWKDIELMLKDCMSSEYRDQLLDDFGGGWVYSWHCMDHVGYSDNRRRKDLGYGNVYRYYKNIIEEMESHQDEINWHYHPLSFDRNPLKCAANYVNSFDVLNNILCRRIIDENWFPTVNRPGFHTERIDIHLFLEQWIPFDYANNYSDTDTDNGQKDLIGGRFGDWRRSSRSWTGYHPSHDDYQVVGLCRRIIFRCLNVGTRFKTIKEQHVLEALSDAEKNGVSILSFANHDWRDIRPDVEYIRNIVTTCRKKHPNVKIKFSGAREAAKDITFRNEKGNYSKLILKGYFKKSKFIVEVKQGELFGPQPFLAIKTIDGKYLHDNFDVEIPTKRYSYTFDHHTIDKRVISKIAAASADKYGHYDIVIIGL
jgi:hypothetical protein